MKYIPFLIFPFIPSIKAFLDTIIFRSGKSIFPQSWNPFNSYSTTPLTLGLIRLDPYHKMMYVFIAFLVAFAKVYQVFGPLFGYWDVAIFLIEWGVFFELNWRLFYKPAQ